MKRITKLSLVLLAALPLLFATTSCSEEFQVEESQLVGTWYFPLSNSLVDTATGFDWRGAKMIIKSTDTLTVNALPGTVFTWLLRDNSVTAINEGPAVGEQRIIAFTVYEATSSSLKINGKYRYQYDGENTPMGDISCTLTHTDPNAVAGK